MNATKGTAIVERVNFQKKHTRPNPQKNVKGGILERESAIRMDKLQVLCPSCGEARVRFGEDRRERQVDRGGNDRGPLTEPCIVLARDAEDAGAQAVMIFDTWGGALADGRPTGRSDRI